MQTVTSSLPTFEFEAVASIQALQDAVRHLVGAMPERIRTAAELQRAMGIDYKLSWNLFKLLKAKVPLEAAEYVPGASSLRKLAGAALAKGVNEELVETLRIALERFDSVVSHHAVDRSSFKAMASAVVSDESAQMTWKRMRREAFKIESQLWGSQTATILLHDAVRRNVDGTLSIMMFNRRVGMHRLRAEARPAVHGVRFSDANAAPTANHAEPLDREAHAIYGAPLLPDFCTRPIPRLARVEVPTEGWVWHVLESDQLGRSGAVDITTGEVYRQGTLTHLSDGRNMFWSATNNTTPCEQIVKEVALHRDSFSAVRPAFRTIPRAGVNFLNELETPVPQMPTFESVEHLGPVDRCPPPSGVPNYGELVRYTYARLGWSAADFDLYRVTLTHPVLNTRSVLKFDLEPMK